MPVFGNHKSPSVRVATVGLNPSATEFLDDKGDWKPETKRLPLVTDFGVRERGDLNAEHIEQANKLRAEYFQRPHHSFFGPLQGLLSAVNIEWNYVAGTAVHVDLVACGTWRAWSEMSGKAIQAVVANCHNHLIQTLTELPDGTFLLLDGRTVNTTLAANSFDRVEDTIGEVEVVTVWRGSLQIEGKCFKYAGWSKPVDKVANCLYLKNWLQGVIASCG